MFYEGVDGSNTSRIGRATSPDGVVWTRSATPVLEVAAAGAFGAGGVFAPSVLFDGTTYHVWYGANQPTGSRPSGIGYATSGDGVTWTLQNSGNPVLLPGASGEWDYWFVGQPSVVLDGSTYKMWYSNDDLLDAAIGYATSSDGVAWTRYAGNPVAIASNNGWSSNGLTNPSVIKEGSTYRMWASPNFGNYPRVGYLASPDGIAWTEWPGNPLLFLTSGAWDENGDVEPAALRVGGSLRFYYVSAGSIGAAENPPVY